MASTPVLPQTPKLGITTIVNADGTGLKTLYTAGASGSKVSAAVVTSTDTSNRSVRLWVTRGGTDYLLGTALIPDLSGSNGTDPTVNALSLVGLPGLPVDDAGQPYIFLESGDVLKASVVVAVTAALTVTVMAIGADF